VGQKLDRQTKTFSCKSADGLAQIPENTLRNIFEHYAEIFNWQDSTVSHSDYYKPTVFWEFAPCRQVEDRQLMWMQQLSYHTTRLNSPEDIFTAFQLLLFYFSRQTQRDENRQLAGRRRRWQDSINLGIGEIRFEDVNWDQVAYCKVQPWAFMNTVINFEIP
jgi:hypothetical protein